MTLETLRLVVVSGLAVWGAVDLSRRILRWSEGDADELERHAERRRALGDVTRGRRG